MKLVSFLLPLVMAGLARPAQAEAPHQPGLFYFDVSFCKDAFNADDYAAMSAVTEVPEARARFPGSYMFVPGDGAAHPGVVWLHGSEGGRFSTLSMCHARFLATKGYAALFFCYSDCGSDALPEAIHDVDLQRTAEAVHWLRASRYVGGRKVALSGVSRGAEQTVLVGSILAAKALTDPSIDVPDALFAHSPFGTVVGGFNWRWSDATDFRWGVWVQANLACLRDDAAGPYDYQAADGTKRRLAWKTDDPGCVRRPALAPFDCWRADADGPYTDPDSGAHYDWLADLCGVAPSIDWHHDDVQAWTWGGGTAETTIGRDIALSAFTGGIMISEGNQDDVWPYAGGAAYLMRQLTQAGVAFAHETIPVLTGTPTPLPTPPAGRVVFETFDGEKHRYGPAASAVEWGLELPFLARELN